MYKPYPTIFHVHLSLVPPEYGGWTTYMERCWTLHTCQSRKAWYFCPWIIRNLFLCLKKLLLIFLLCPLHFAARESALGLKGKFKNLRFWAKCTSSASEGTATPTSLHVCSFAIYSVTYCQYKIIFPHMTVCKASHKLLEGLIIVALNYRLMAFYTRLVAPPTTLHPR